MTDIRESILARLVVIAQSVDGIKTVRRNAIELAETASPAIIVMDGDETANDADIGTPITAPRRVTMTPTIVIAATAAADQIGTTINEFRAALLKAILTDTMLGGLSLNGSGIRYEGCTSDLARGNKAIGQINLAVSITYHLKPGDL